MKSTKVTIVRIYITESSGLLRKIVKYLHDDVKVRGVSVFRAISGFGESGKTHESSLIDLSLDLPLVIEFFDNTDKINEALNYFTQIVKAEHIVFWEASVNEIT